MDAEVAVLMRDCWRADPAKRPAFAEIERRLLSLEVRPRRPASDLLPRIAARMNFLPSRRTPFHPSLWSQPAPTGSPTAKTNQVFFESTPTFSPAISDARSEYRLLPIISCSTSSTRSDAR